MNEPVRDDEELTAAIIECIIKVHQVLGPGFEEFVYRNSLVIELSARNIAVEHEKEIAIRYEGHFVGKHRLDLLVDSRIVMELKTVETLGRAHYAQIRSCLKAAGKRIGLLVNFSTAKADFRRVELD